MNCSTAVVMIYRVTEMLFLSEDNCKMSSLNLMIVAFMSKKHVIMNYFRIFCNFPIHFIWVAFSFCHHYFFLLLIFLRQIPF